MARLERYSGVFTEGRLRTLLAAARPRLSARGYVIPGNGLLEVGAVIQVGRRVFVDVERFDAWINSKRLCPDAL